MANNGVWRRHRRKIARNGRRIAVDETAKQGGVIGGVVARGGEGGTRHQTNQHELSAYLCHLKYNPIPSYDLTPSID